MDVKELFNSESKSQVYAHLHELLQKQTMDEIGILIVIIISWYQQIPVKQLFGKYMKLIQ